MQELLTHEVKRKKFVEASKNIVQKKYKGEQITDELVVFYKEIIASYHRSTTPLSQVNKVATFTIQQTAGFSRDYLHPSTSI